MHPLSPKTVLAMKHGCDLGQMDGATFVMADTVGG